MKQNYKLLRGIEVLLAQKSEGDDGDALLFALHNNKLLRMKKEGCLGGGIKIRSMR